MALVAALFRGHPWELVFAMLRVIRISTHVLLFIAAVVVFYLGLGMGLTQSPTIGTLLWLAAGLILAGNLWWILRRSRSR